MSQNNGVYSYCEKSTQHSVHSRRCFMTGELCSKQSSVHRKREELHRDDHINAFVVMNFSDMSDVVYKWKLRPFIESLKKYLFLKKEGQKTTDIACVVHENDKTELPDPDKWVPVKQIHVIRADSDTESNYVICDRVCQQMQIADLIIVDVSVENTNVFYEFGMAAAFGKLILPICYNESFYQMRIPEAAQRILEEERIRQAKAEYSDGKKKNKERLEDLRKMIEQHIDCYPWRRRLFEFYGIRYRKHDSKVGYTKYKDITNPVFGFSDIQYARFPYDHKMKYPPKEHEKDGIVEPDDRKKVGYHLYNRLAISYNRIGADEKKTSPNDQNGEEKKKPSPYNTLVVYTMDSVLNGEQAGQCIVNYYRNMTARIREEYCFCGDRVGILGQSNKIHDDPKDTKTDQKLMYQVSDIIRIGMNEATHMALQKKIKTEDFLKTDPKGDEEALRLVKEHIRNRCVPAYPDEPIYIELLKEGIQKGVLDLPKDTEQDSDARKYFFCLFHVMLHTLRYTNEIVVDLSRNSLQALFWLGVAHGSDAHAITVRHAPTEQELERSGEQRQAGERQIFDVAGLWTAILTANDTDGFYRQLTKAQLGIEQSNKLILPDSQKYQEQVLDQYHASSPYMKGGYTGFQELLKRMEENPADPLLGGKAKDMLLAIQENERLCRIWKALTEQNQKESKQLESYYRSCFWRRMLRQNALQLYIPEKEGRVEETDQPCRVNIGWDVNAAAELSHYLSKRLMIGSYRQTMLRDKGVLPDAGKQNFISIGDNTKPLAKGNGKDRQTLVEYVRDKVKTDQPRVKREIKVTCKRYKKNKRIIRGFFGKSDSDVFVKREIKVICRRIKKNKRVIRGFFGKPDGKSDSDVFAWFPETVCIQNQKKDSGEDPKPQKNEVHFAPEDPKAVACCGCDGETVSPKGCYQQLAQLLLWREADKGNPREMRFWVSLVGVSGPATLALTALLVNPTQQEELFQRKGQTCQDGKQPRHLLNRLQTEIRKSFVKKYNALLEKAIDKEAYEKVRYATNLYLSTVLYQYFFPFLTKADEKRILNGMEAFLVAYNQTKLTEGVIGVLEKAMNALRGVEALYEVTVEYSGTDTDSRWPKGIKPLEHDDVPQVRCLFAEDTGGQTQQTNT